jgi:hypothetical protein
MYTNHLQIIYNFSFERIAKQFLVSVLDNILTKRKDISQNL